MLWIIIILTENKRMQPFTGVLFKLISEHANEPTFQPGHVTVHICEKIKREFTSWFDLFVYTAQDTFDLAGHCCFGDAGFHPAIKAERHKLTFQHC